MLLKLSCFWFPIVRTSEGQLHLLIAVHSDKAYDIRGKKYFFCVWRLSGGDFILGGGKPTLTACTRNVKLFFLKKCLLEGFLEPYPPKKKHFGPWTKSVGPMVLEIHYKIVGLSWPPLDITLHCNAIAKGYLDF